MLKIAEVIIAAMLVLHGLFGIEAQALPADRYLAAIAVQHEAGGLSEEYRQCVAEVIRARVESGSFPDTVAGVLFQRGQFQGINDWITDPRWLPDEVTLRAVDNAFSRPDPHGCEYYYNPALSDRSAVSWFEYSGDVTYIFSIAETSWGVRYETRFFRA